MRPRARRAIKYEEQQATSKFQLKRALARILEQYLAGNYEDSS